MAFMTESEYFSLLLINPDTLYFIYEDNDDWGFGDEFPVTLTDGTEGLGEFPINLI